MYHALVKKVARRTYEELSRRDYDGVVRSFAPSGFLYFAGDHPLAGTFRGPDAVGEWFERLFSYFPDLELLPETIIVEGFPWDTRVATRFRVSASLPGGVSYANEGMQLLRLRWGRVIEDRLYEDTQTLIEALAGIQRPIEEARPPRAP